MGKGLTAVSDGGVLYYPQVITGDNIDPQVVAQVVAPVHLVLWSSPYPGLYGFDVSVEDYLGEWLPARVDAYTPQLATGGVWVQVIIFPRTADGQFDLRVFDVGKVYQQRGYYCANLYIWDKLNAPPSGNHKRDDDQGYEVVFVMSKDGEPRVVNRQRKPYADSTVNKAKTGNMRQTNVKGTHSGGHHTLHPDGALQDNVLRMSSSADQNRPRSQGGSFPRGLADRFILTYTNPGDHVVDICAGAGTSLVQSLLHGRRSTGVEIRPKRADKARAWVDDTWNTPAQLRMI